VENLVKQDRDLKKANEIVQESADKNGKQPEITPERIQRVKKAFKPTWLEEQIANEGQVMEKPSEKGRKSS
jgi:hypothetical protein